MGKRAIQKNTELVADLALGMGSLQVIITELEQLALHPDDATFRAGKEIVDRFDAEMVNIMTLFNSILPPNDMLDPNDTTMSEQDPPDFSLS